MRLRRDHEGVGEQQFLQPLAIGLKLFEFNRPRASVLSLFAFAELGNDLDELLRVFSRRQVPTLAEDN